MLQGNFQLSYANLENTTDQPEQVVSDEDRSCGWFRSQNTVAHQQFQRSKHALRQCPHVVVKGEYFLHNGDLVTKTLNQVSQGKCLQPPRETHLQSRRQDGEDVHHNGVERDEVRHRVVQLRALVPHAGDLSRSHLAPPRDTVRVAEHLQK